MIDLENIYNISNGYSVGQRIAFAYNYKLNIHYSYGSEYEYH